MDNTLETMTLFDEAKTEEKPSAKVEEEALKAGVKLTQRRPRLYSHVAVTDGGGAPCVESNLLSFNICKRGIRKGALIGDALICFSGGELHKKGDNRQILWIAVITDVRTMVYYAEHYPTRPDSIYTPELKLKPDNLFHDDSNVEGDLKGENVILSTNFIYFGTKSIDVPSDMTGIIPGRAYKYKPNEPFMDKLIAKFNEEKKNGMGKRGKHPSGQCGPTKPTNKSSSTSC